MTTQTPTFQEALQTEREDIANIEKWLTGTFKLKKTWPSTLKEQTEQDIDLHAITQTDLKVSFEVKIRYKRYDDVLIETLSCEEKKTPGWIYSSKAKFLVYAFMVKDAPIYGDTIDLRLLKAWWANQGLYQNYPISYGKTYTKNGSILYRTQNRQVPIEHIPFHFFHAHRRYGFLKPLDEEALDPRYTR